MRFSDNVELTAANMADTDILAGTDVSVDGDRKFSLAGLGDWFLNRFTGLSLAGANQSVKSAIDGLKDSTPYVTPEMYGAKGDGTTDDSAAFQAAVNSGRTVLLDSKVYLVKNVSVTHDIAIIGDGATIQTIEKQANSNQFSNVFTATNADLFISGVRFLGLGAALTTTNERLITLINATGGNVFVNKCSFYNFDTLNRITASDLGVDRVGTILTAVSCKSVRIINSDFDTISGDEMIWVISGLVDQSGQHEMSGCTFDNITSQSINILHGDILIRGNVFNEWQSATSVFNFNGTSLTADSNVFRDGVSSDVFNCYEIGYMRMNDVTITNNTLIGCKNLRFANLCGDSILVSGNHVSCGTFLRVANLMAVQSVFPFDNSTAKQVESVIISNNYIDLFETNTTGIIAAGMQIMYREGVSATLPDNTLPLKNLLIEGNTIRCNPDLVKADLAGGYKSGFVFALGNKIDSVRIKNNTIINIPKAMQISSTSTMMCYVQNYYDKSIGYFDFDDIVMDRDTALASTIFYFIYFRNETGYSPTVPAIKAIRYGSMYFSDNAQFSDPRRWTGNNAAGTTVNEYTDPYVS